MWFSCVTIWDMVILVGIILDMHQAICVMHHNKSTPELDLAWFI